MSPYRITFARHGRYRVINFSGGRSSGYMLYHILKEHGGILPPNTVVVFCNTGKELPETLEFVHACEERWSVPIVWLEYFLNHEYSGERGDHKIKHKVVDFESASRNGEPFESMIKYSRLIPTQGIRRCTAELKVSTVERYVRRELGWREPGVRILGIRWDEPRRWKKALYEECSVRYPMVDAGVSERDVREWWCRQPFDLGIESWEGNCDLCFLVGKKKLLRRIRRRPGSVEWWARMEEEMSRVKANKDAARFSLRYTYAELADKAAHELELPLDADDSSADCFCGD